MQDFKHQIDIQEYYGKILKSSTDLKTNACCSSDAVPEKHRKILAELPTEILEKFYGCGSPIPMDLEGLTILDLGCGSGRDAYLLSKLVGPKGKVIGIDMTEEQLQIAQKHVTSQSEKWGYAKANMEFHHSYIEDLSAYIADASIDIVISNCVINLSPSKEAVFREIFRVLKPGGELYFSDIFAGRRVPEALQMDAVLQGECLAGALYWEDFRRILRKVGCLDYRFMSKRKIAIGNVELENRIGRVDFWSATVRAFKLPNLEDVCEDYGQTATYLGTIPNAPHTFALDDHHLFETGKPNLVCGNTASMLADTRWGRHFKVIGEMNTHFGIFACGPNSAPLLGEDVGGACC